jgi:hypothetical protein
MHLVSKIPELRLGLVNDGGRTAETTMVYHRVKQKNLGFSVP